MPAHSRSIMASNRATPPAQPEAGLQSGPLRACLESSARRRAGVVLSAGPERSFAPSGARRPLASRAPVEKSRRACLLVGNPARRARPPASRGARSFGLWTRPGRRAGCRLGGGESGQAQRAARAVLAEGGQPEASSNLARLSAWSRSARQSRATGRARRRMSSSQPAAQPARRCPPRAITSARPALPRQLRQRRQERLGRRRRAEQTPRKEEGQRRSQASRGAPGKLGLWPAGPRDELLSARGQSAVSASEQSGEDGERWSAGAARVALGRGQEHSREDERDGEVQRREERRQTRIQGAAPGEGSDREGTRTRSARPLEGRRVRASASADAREGCSVAVRVGQDAEDLEEQVDGLEGGSTGVERQPGVAGGHSRARGLRTHVEVQAHCMMGRVVVSFARGEGEDEKGTAGGPRKDLRAPMTATRYTFQVSAGSRKQVGGKGGRTVLVRGQFLHDLLRVEEDVACASRSKGENVSAGGLADFSEPCARVSRSGAQAGRTHPRRSGTRRARGRGPCPGRTAGRCRPSTS